MANREEMSTTPISATSLQGGRSAVYGEMRGHTLIELLIVLLILGAVAALAAPRFDRLLGSVRQSHEREEVFGQIAGLGYEALSRGIDLQLGNYPPKAGKTHPLSLPEGWRIETEAPVLYRANGVCLHEHKGSPIKRLSVKGKNIP